MENNFYNVKNKKKNDEIKQGFLQHFLMRKGDISGDIFWRNTCTVEEVFSVLEGVPASPFPMVRVAKSQQCGF